MLCADIVFSPFTMQTLCVLALGHKDNTSKHHPFIQWDHVPYSCELVNRIMIQVKVIGLSFLLDEISIECSSLFLLPYQILLLLLFFFSWLVFFVSFSCLHTLIPSPSFKCYIPGKGYIQSLCCTGWDTIIHGKNKSPVIIRQKPLLS